MWRKVLALVLGLVVLATNMVSALSGVQNHSNAMGVLDRAELDLIQKERFDPKVQEYYRILKFMELNGINTREFLLMLEKRTRKTHETVSIDEAIALAKQYYQQKTGKRIDDNALKALTAEEPLKPMSSTEVDTIYDIYNPSKKIYVQTRTKLKFDINDAFWIGMATYVHMKDEYVGKPTPKGNGIIPEHYDYTWTMYTCPEEEKNWVIDDLKRKYGIQEYMIERVHIKYFVNGKTDKAYYEGWSLGINMGTTIAGHIAYYYSWIELWSEANYYPDSGWAPPIGYPYDQDGGAERIKNNGEVHTSAGFAMDGYSPYPILSYREFGAGSETHIPLKIYSSIWHQQQIQR